MRKLRKLAKDPDRFLFDLFAKRMARRSPASFGANAPEDTDVFATADLDGDPPDLWGSLAERFGMRSGALTGLTDQSLLLESTVLPAFLHCLCLAAHRAGSRIRLRAGDPMPFREVGGSDLLHPARVHDLHKALGRVAAFVCDIAGAAEVSCAREVFLFDTGPDETISLRSNAAFVKKATPSALANLYPPPPRGEQFLTPFPVDIVYTYVDRDDPDWQALWVQAFPDRSPDADRHASKDELRHSLRAICKYLPWFRRLFVVSNCRRPDWLAQHPRLTWVDHHDIFPDTCVLPTFNSHAIETCLHRIADLSEHFVYFNDDVFVTSPSYVYDFFTAQGLSIAQLEPYGMVTAERVAGGGPDHLAAAANGAACLGRLFPGYAARQLHKHTPLALRKSILADIEAAFPDEFARTRRAGLRKPTDISVPSFLYHHYALATARAAEGRAAAFLAGPRTIGSLLSRGTIAKYKFVCFNDGGGSADDLGYRRNFGRLMQAEFPDASRFERPASPQ